MSRLEVTWTDVPPPVVAETEWQVLTLSGHPLRQETVARDARWRTLFLNTWDTSRLVSTVPVLFPRGTRFGDEHLNELFGGEAPETLCVVGSPVDYVTDVPTAQDLTNERTEILGLVCREAETAARKTGRRVAAAGVPLDVAECLIQAAGGQRTMGDVHFALSDVGPRVADYLQQLSRGRRDMARRDLRKIGEAGLTRSWVGCAPPGGRVATTWSPPSSSAMESSSRRGWCACASTAGRGHRSARRTDF